MAATDLLVNSAVNAKVEFDPENNPESSGDKVTFPSTDWTINEEPNIVELVNSRDGVVRKPSFKDVPTVTVNFIPDEVDVDPGVDVVIGTRGVLRLFYTATKYRELTAVLGPINQGSGNPGNPQTVSATFMLASGTITNGEVV